VTDQLQRTVRPLQSAYRLDERKLLALLPDTGVEGAVAWAERFLKQLRAARLPRQLDTWVDGVNVSIGVCTAPGNASSSSELVERANEALLFARASGADWEVWRPNLTGSYRGIASGQ
jgi:PleD family two-component response regulator